MEIYIWRWFFLMRAKKIKKKHEERWSKIRDFFRSITKNSDGYDKKYLKKQQVLGFLR